MEDKKILDVFSISKSQRILVWICEAIITFAIAYILMHAAVVPLYSLIFGYGPIADEADNAIKKRNRLLLENKLIYFENDEGQIGDISYGLEYTYRLFMEDFIKGEDSHNVFKVFYDNFDQSEETYYSMFKIYDDELHLFLFNDDSKSVDLKDEYKTQFSPLIDKSDEMSVEGKKIFEKYRDKVFLTFYSHILRQMESQNTILSGESYNNLQNKINKSTQFYNQMMLIGSYLSYALGFAITSILIPLLNRNKRSISMIMMRIQRISFDDFRILKTPRFLLGSFYNLICYLFTSFLIPLPLISIGYLFSIPALIYPSIISAFICIFSFVTILISGANRSTSDILGNALYVSNDTLDDIYRAKGYKI